jgi:hypothetical protein
MGMSTNPNPLSELNTPKPIDFCPVAPPLRPTRVVTATRSQNRIPSRLQDLGTVIERLFAFYEAMKTGKPVANGDEMLAQVGLALVRSTRSRNQA